MICIICNTDFKPTNGNNNKYCSKKCAYDSNRLLAKKRYHKSNKKKHIQRARETHYKIKYGITIKEYNKIYKKQKGVCAICGLPESLIMRTGIIHLSIDHNHKTGKIRGLLCHRCNRALGYFNDNPFLLVKAIKYLKV